MSGGTNDHAEDRALAEAMAALDPADARLARMEEAVLSGLRERPPSLVAEWLDLFQSRPVVHGAYALAAAAVLLATTPTGAALALLLR